MNIFFKADKVQILKYIKPYIYYENARWIKVKNWKNLKRDNIVKIRCKNGKLARNKDGYYIYKKVNGISSNSVIVKPITDKEKLKKLEPWLYDENGKKN